MTAELNDGVPDGERVNHKRVARVMKAHDLAGIRLRRRVRTTLPEPADQKYPDLLKRDFTAQAPNQRYVGDITCLPLPEGRNLYLATVIDCFSRKLAGWAIADHMRTELVEDALKAACVTGPEPQPGAPTAPPPSPDAPANGAGRTLLVYFSRAGENYYYGDRRNLDIGNTAALAGLIADRIDCEVYEIEAADPYPEAYDPTVTRNTQERQANARPAMANPLPDLSGYDTVLIGSPVWGSRAPMIMSTFIESVDLKDKTVLPFVTYAVSGMSGIDEDYRNALPDSVVRDGLAVQGEAVADATAAIEDWLTVNDLLTRR